MMPALVGLGAALVVIAHVWSTAILVVRLRRSKRRRVAAERRAEQRRLTSEPGEERDPRATAVIRDAERALADARREADAIVAAAETRAAEIEADAERARRAVLARASSEADETRRDLTTLLHDLLADVRRPDRGEVSGAGSSSAE